MGALHVSAVIDDPELRRLYDYWAERRGGRLAPSRTDIDPAELTWILPRLMLIDVADDIGDFRVRLMGTEVAKEFGEDRTGQRFAEIDGVENLDQVFAIYEQVARDCVPHYERERPVSELRSYRGYSRLMLPLSDGGPGASMILVGLAYFGRRISDG
ncbi:PAS domain-containing protein [Nisaea sp.]|uniref:PAS domain-containing protein n=1 Tax=Nisaea sp. TaxID=2024842 RepID=UPI003B51E0C5